MIQWNAGGDYEGLTLTVQRSSDGATFTETFPGRSANLSLRKLGNDVNGSYTYELRATPRLSGQTKAALAQARANEDDAEIARIQRELNLGELVQSGHFLVMNGSFVPYDATEGDANDAARAGGAPSTEGTSAEPTASADRRPGRISTEDQVIPDDLIVQSSTCTGFDCVDGESFGFDTLRLKENNLRIHFEDTSTSAGFAANDWRIIANDSTSGGANKFVIEDSTAARNPMTIEAAAPANSLYVDAQGDIGIQQAAPLLDIHITTGDTPAIRLEQTNASGFTAQTWDIGANEANFFVRDLTGGSRLPFRIRPGATTSSIDIAASGQVGINTASPKTHGGLLQVNGTNPGMLASFGIDVVPLTMYHNGGQAALMYNAYNDLTNFKVFRGTNHAGSAEFNASFGTYSIKSTAAAGATDANLTFVERFTILSSGFTGVGNSAPTQPFMVGVAGSGSGGNGAHVTAGGTWTNGSSREFKEHIEELSADEAAAAVASLKPVRYNYKAEPTEQYVGFIAEEVPELVAQTSTERKYLSPMDIVATLTKVVQEQQKTIEELKGRLDAIEEKK